MNKKIALITGGTGYIGSALTKEFLVRGWEVAALSRSSIEFPCDVTDAASVHAAVEKAVHTFGPLGAVVHAAAAPIEHVTKEAATAESNRLQTSVSRQGAQNLFDAVAPHMEKSGVFIAITSDATKSEGELKMGGYVDAKREMEAFVKGLQAPFRTLVYSAGFLPGGLNKDLPEMVKSFFAAKSKTLDQVVKEITDLCE